MACRKYHKWLPLFIDASLSERQQIKISEHLQVCEECLREVEAYRKVLHLVGGLQEVKAPGDFYLRCNQRFECEVISKPRIGLWQPLAWGSAGAALLLAGLLIAPNSLWKPFAIPEHSMAGKRPSAESASSARTSGAVNGKSENAEFSIPLEIPESLRASRIFQAQSSLYRSAVDMLPPPPGLARTIAFHPGSEPAFPSTDNDGIAESIPEQQVWRGDYCAIREAMSIVAKSESELRSLYARAEIAPGRVDVDWDQFMVLAVFAGQKSGPRAEIKATVDRSPDGGLLLRYHLEKSDLADANGGAYQPYLLMLLPRTSLPVKVQED